MPAGRPCSGEAHPDRFAVPGQRLPSGVALQWSVRINEAYQRLKDPQRRAAYLCEMNGAPVEAENNTAMPAAFLMQQMEWREALDEAKDAEAVERIATEVAAHRKRMLATVETLIDTQHDYPAASAQVRALMFIDRFAADVDERLEALEQ